MTTVLQLKKTSFSNTVYVHTTAGVYVLSVDIVAKLGLRPGSEIQNLFELEQSSYHYQLREFSLRQVAISPKNKQVLSKKVEQKYRFIKTKYGYSSDYDYQNILDELEQKKLINAHDYAGYLSRRYKNKSKEYLRQKMLQSGVESSLVSETITNLDPSQELQQMEKLIQKQLLKYQKLPKNKQYIKIMSSLYQKGFPISKAKDMLDLLLPDRYNS